MTKQPFRFTLFLLICVLIPLTATAQTVNIPDSNLRAAVEKALGKASGASITTADMERLTRLAERNANISNLTGLESATNLTTLDLDENNITDLSPVVGLTNLAWLLLGGNNISDISVLGRLTNLTDLSLYNNNISDISAVTELADLTRLWLEGNNISDLSPLVANTGLGSGDEVYVRRNPLNHASIKTHIPALQSRGVTVEFDNVITELVNIPDSNLRSAIEKTLGKASGTTITTADMANLTSLEAQNVNINNLTGLEAAPNLRWLDLGTEYVEAERRYINSNSISDLSPLVNLTNLTSLDLGDNNISDLSPLSGLTQLARLELSGSSITDLSPLVSLTNLITLYLGDNDISDLSPVAGLTNLTSLYLGDNDIPDLSALAGLTQLTDLSLGGNSISDLSPLAGLTQLTDLHLGGNSITDLSPLEGLTNLTDLHLGGNSITDLSPLEGLTNLTDLHLGGNSITDLSPLAGLTNLTQLYLEGNDISDLSPVAGLTKLTWLSFQSNNISDLSPLTGLTKLRILFLQDNNISDLSPLVGLTQLPFLVLMNNNISDLSPLAGLTHLTGLGFSDNNISDLSPLSGLTNLTGLGLQSNNISDLSPLAGLTNLTQLFLENNNISDLSPLVENTGLGEGDTVDVSGNPLNYASINTHIPALQSRGVEIRFENLKPMVLEYLLSIPADISLIHIPLKVTAVDGVEQSITSIADLYDALGGAENVSFLVTHDPQAPAQEEWRSYLGASGKGTPADAILTDDKGIIASLKNPTSIRLSGAPLGTGGTSTITLHPGLNVVGLPLNDSRITRVSDLFTLDGIQDNVPVIILSDNGDFKTVGRAGDPGDIAVTGGQAFILNAQQAATVTISGEGWTNGSGTTAAPLIGNSLLQRDTTPVLALRGAVVDEATRFKSEGIPGDCQEPLNR